MSNIGTRGVAVVNSTSPGNSSTAAYLQKERPVHNYYKCTVVLRLARTSTLDKYVDLSTPPVQKPFSAAAGLSGCSALGVICSSHVSLWP